jgi:hypothetical protein
MGEVINLRQARKIKQRRDREQSAAEARALHGRSKADRKVAQAEQERTMRLLDQSRRECAEPDE